LASGSDHRRYIIQHVQHGSPAEKAGLKAGDEIISMGILPSRFYTLEVLSRKLADPKKEKIKLKIKRGSEKLKVKLQLSDDWAKSP